MASRILVHVPGTSAPSCHFVYVSLSYWSAALPPLNLLPLACQIVGQVGLPCVTAWHPRVSHVASDVEMGYIAKPSQGWARTQDLEVKDTGGSPLPAELGSPSIIYRHNISFKLCPSSNKGVTQEEPEIEICPSMLDAINEYVDLFWMKPKLVILLNTYTTLFFPFLDKLLPYLMPMWGKERTSAEKRIAICIFVDVGEHCGDATFKYEETFVPVVLEACNDTSTDVRQAVVYGVGVCAEFRGSTFNLPTIEQS
ncbi:importin-5-like protein [Tanacetum coccineum]